MKAEIEEKLRKHTTEIRDIMFLAQSAFKVVDYLYRERTGAETEVINTNQFFLHAAEIYWRTYTIEMAKLFTDRKSEHFNVHDYIKKFKPGGEYRTPAIPDTSIIIWEQNLTLTKEAAWIENILQQRDGKYGHTDKKRDHIKNILSFSDARELLHIVHRMLSQVYSSVFGETMFLEPINEPVGALKRTVRILAQRQQQLIDLEKRL